MSREKMVLVLVFSLLQVFPGNAETTDRIEHMRLLLEECGILDRLRVFPRQVFKAMGHNENTEQPNRYTPERDAFFQAFNVKEMENELITLMVEKMNEHHNSVALEWFQSPIGMRITDLERKTYSEHAWHGRQTFVEGLSHKSPGPQRIASIQQLTDASYLSQIDEDLEMTTALALTRSMNATLPEEEQIDPDHIRHAIQVQREDRRQALEEEKLMNFLYLYHQLPDREVAQYVDFLDSETGKKFNSAMLSSLNAVFQSASQKIGTALGRALKGERRI